MSSRGGFLVYRTAGRTGLEPDELPAELPAIGLPQIRISVISDGQKPQVKRRIPVCPR